MIRVIARRELVLLGLLLTLCSVTPGRAATNTDILTGIVRDARGESLAGARVTATELGSGISRTTHTDAQGRYTLVFPGGGGRYRLVVGFHGLATAHLIVARETDEEVLVQDVRMSVQALALDGILVSGRAPVRAVNKNEMEPGAREYLLKEGLLARIPEGGSDPVSAALAASGVPEHPPEDAGEHGLSVPGPGSAPSQVTLDGAASQPLGGGPSPFRMGRIPPDAVREVRVTTHSYTASRGGLAGGDVAVTTRGGGNTFRSSFRYNLVDPL
jgi:hypothetical protein